MLKAELKDIKIALVIYSCPFHFPPTINAANILSEMNAEVHLLGIEYKNSWIQMLDEKVKLVYFKPGDTGLREFIGYWKSFYFLIKYFKKNKINRAIAYDARPVLPVFIAAKICNVKWIYHQHDFWDDPKGIWQKILHYLEFKIGSKADIVSFPQVFRANLFSKLSGMKKKPLIVFNGPRLEWITKSKTTIHPDIKEIKKKFDKILIYQGCVSKYFGLENLLNGVKYCKSYFAVIIIGQELEKNIKNDLRNQAKNNNILERIIFWDGHPGHDKLPSITMYCDIGIAKLTYESMDAPVNDKYLAGASNKITEYMAAGLPIISANTEDNRNFYLPENIGLLCNPIDPTSIAQAIDSLLLNDKLSSDMSINNRKLFETKYNFDKQFAKIINQLE